MKEATRDAKKSKKIEMNVQCVPSWGVDEDTVVHAQPPPPSNSLAFHVPADDGCRLELDYEVAELKWQNGQVAMHGLGPPRHLYTKPGGGGGGGTLESLVDQATHLQHNADVNHDDLPPWFGLVNSGGVSMDALVPCANTNNYCNIVKRKNRNEDSEHVPGMGPWQQTTTLDTSCDRDGQLESFTLTTTSAENTNSGAGKEDTKTYHDWVSKEDTKTYHDWVSLSSGQSQREGMCKKKSCGRSGKSSISTKSSRAAAIHNQSERKRRDRINQRMKTLQKLVPNSSKTDKASMLDEVIEYLKQLQTQVQLMSRMVPLAMQHLHMASMMPPISGMATMGMGMPAMRMGMGIGIPPLPMQPSWDNTPDPFLVFSNPNLLPYFACQSSQATSIEAYSRFVALFQQFQQSMGAGSDSKS